LAKGGFCWNRLSRSPLPAQHRRCLSTLKLLLIVLSVRSARNPDTNPVEASSSTPRECKDKKRAALSSPIASDLAPSSDAPSAKRPRRSSGTFGSRYDLRSKGEEEAAAASNGTPIASFSKGKGKGKAAVQGKKVSGTRRMPKKTK
jgi:hypothetical protein